MIFKKIGNMENVEVICHYLVSIKKSSEAEACPRSKLLGIHFKIK